MGGVEVEKSSSLAFSYNLKEVHVGELVKLIWKNLHYFTNYFRINNDEEDAYLWMSLAEDKDFVISYNIKILLKKRLDIIVLQISFI